MSVSTTSGSMRCGHGQRLAAVAGLADDLDVGFDVEQGRQCAEHHALIFGDEHPNPRHGYRDGTQRDRQLDQEPRAALGLAAQCPAKRLYPFAHAGQAVPERRIAAAAVVATSISIEPSRA